MKQKRVPLEELEEKLEELKSLYISVGGHAAVIDFIHMGAIDKIIESWAAYNRVALGPAKCEPETIYLPVKTLHASKIAKCHATVADKWHIHTHWTVIKTYEDENIILGQVIIEKVKK